MNQYGFSKSFFYDWCIEKNDRQDLLDRWDYDLNENLQKRLLLLKI